MTLWAGKELKSLTDEELIDAINSVASMDNFRFDKFKDPRINRPKHRLHKIFNANPPVENSVFTNLVQSLNQEYQSRNKSNEAEI